MTAAWIVAGGVIAVCLIAGLVDLWSTRQRVSYIPPELRIGGRLGTAIAWLLFPIASLWALGEMAVSAVRSVWRRPSVLQVKSDEIDRVGA